MKATKFLKNLSFVILAVLLVLAVYATITVSAQNQYTSNIAERLKKRGMPVKYVITLKRIPYEIEVALQSVSDNDHLSLEDNWFMQLTRREAILTYRVDTRLDSFKLVVFNSKDKIIYSTQTYLYPEDLSQQLISPGQSKVDNSTTKEIIANELQLEKLSLDSMDVFSEDIDGFNGQILVIQISTENIDTANQSLPKFLSSFFQTMDTVNSKHKTYVVLYKLRLLDQKGNVLLDYVKDLESGSTQWTSVDGLYDEWYSKPKSTSSHTSPIPTPKPVSTSPIPVPTTPK